MAPPSAHPTLDEQALSSFPRPASPGPRGRCPGSSPDLQAQGLSIANTEGG